MVFWTRRGGQTINRRGELVFGEDQDQEKGGSCAENEKVDSLEAHGGEHVDGSERYSC